MFDIVPFSMWLAVAFVALLGVVLFLLALRFGPRRGVWAQPAAAFRAPGGWISALMYILAALHLAAAILVAVSVEGLDASTTTALIVTGIVVALIYVVFANAARLAAVAERRSTASS